MNALASDIDRRLLPAPPIEVLLVDVSGENLRLFIDQPEGVTFSLCEQVTHLLGEYQEQYAIEVSSPGGTAR